MLAMSHSNDTLRANAPLIGLGRRGEADAVVRDARAVLARFPGDLRARAAADALATSTGSRSRR
jgi:hypothetical protein